MKSLNEKGVVTVFLVVILPVLLISGMVLADAAVLLTGRDMAEDAVDCAALAVLGKYSSFLREEYGIYGFYLTEDEIKQIIKDTVERCLDNPGLYDFVLEDVQIEVSGPLADPEVMKNAILSVASDDFYENAINGFLERFDILKGFGGAAEIIGLKMKVDEAVMKFREAGEMLTDLINGGEGYEFYINGIMEFEGLEESADRLSGIFEEIGKLKSEIDALAKAIEETESERVGELNLKEEALGALREIAAEIYHESMEEIIGGLRDANAKAVEYIKTMLEEKVNINLLSGLISEKVSNSNDFPGYIKELLLMVADVIEDVENEAVDLAFDMMEEKINENIMLLSEVILFVEEEIDGDGAGREISIMDGITGYNCDIAFCFIKSGTAGTDEDERGFFEELGKRVLEKRVGKDVEIGDMSGLPSFVYKIQQEEAGFDVTASGESTRSAEAGLSGLDKCASHSLGSMFDSLAINEYLLNHLANETSEASAGHFFTNEVEYILWGSGSQNLNRFYTKSALMGTRFALNAIHVYTDSSKKLKADAIAAATAGWWTMGAGIPVMSNLVKCAWAIAESGFDVGRLCDGGSVAIVKRRADWVTDIGLKSAGIASPEFLCMDYEDYMRIYLLMTGTDKKMTRFADIIQLNSAGKSDIFNTYTKVSIRAVVSFRSITGGRHEEIIEVAREYKGHGIG